MAVTYLYVKHDPLADEFHTQPWAVLSSSGIHSRYATEFAARTAAGEIADRLTAAGFPTRVYVAGQQSLKFA
jgi:hypothetical protein